MSPHARAEKTIDETSKSAVHPFPALANIMGIYVHKGLENHVKEQGFDRQLYWQRLCRDEIRTQNFQQSSLDRAFKMADGELQEILDSQLWLDIFKGASASEAEMDIVYRKGHELVRGSIDLFVLTGEVIKIIDYKTSQHVIGEEGEQLANEQLLQLAKALGYDKQLQAYVEGVSLIYPDKVIKPYILFTKLKKLVAL